MDRFLLATAAINTHDVLLAVGGSQPAGVLFLAAVAVTSVVGLAAPAGMSQLTLR